MPRSKLVAMNSSSQLDELGQSSSKPKDLSWDQSVGGSGNDRRNGWLSAGGADGEARRPQEEKSPNSNFSVEERLVLLEREIAHIVTNTAPTRTLSEYGHEQISEIDFAHWVPKNEIVHISSDEWHEVKGGKFAVPEQSVLTVSTTSRHWAGRHAPPESDVAPRKENGSSMPLPLSDIDPERPYRLAINGYDLHRALETILGLPISLNNNVWIWPFKHFITYESQIRQKLIREEAVLREMDSAREKSGRYQLNAKDEAITGAHSHMWGKNGSYGSDGSVRGETNEEDEKYETSVRLRGQLRCLIQFMDEDMKEIFSIQRKIADGTLRTISFDYLWLLFKPGDVIFSGVTQRRAHRVLHVTGGRAILDIGDQPSTNPRTALQQVRSWEQHEDQAFTYAHSKNTPFHIDSFYIDFDGENFGPVPRRFVIQEFEGEQSIDTLPAFPARFDKNMQETQRMLTKRGKRFVKLAGVSHKKYMGLSAREPSMADYQEEVNSDVVIDFAEAIKKIRKDNPSWSVGLGAGVVDQATRADRREINEIKPCATKGCTLCKQSDIFDDSYHDLEKRSDFMDNTSSLRYRAYAKENLDNDQLLLLPPRVYGYSLLDRWWYALNIDFVEDIKTSVHNGFDDLVLPGDHKHIMQALVKHHTRGSRPTSGKNKTVTDFSMDLVRGKGRGLIILLHGVPGVGKTSTAECVAAQTKRPLFPITCGDIGTTASEVEERLESYFDLAHKWGCVLLLDEADVYLASRERGGDLQRNSLVSVFLRVLEYYSGILILTTNRVGEFDEAFKSRIHISLYYPKLDRESTLKIWDMNLKRIQRSGVDMDVDEDRILKFAQTHWSASKKKLTRRWNGRQIKNAFQTAIALATWDFNDEQEGMNLHRPLLSDKHFQIVSQTSAHFDDYLSNVHGIDEDDAFAVIAERETLRKDDVPRVDWNPRRGSSSALNIPSSNRRRKIHSTSRHHGSSDDDEDKSEGSEDDYEARMQELELELKLQKMKGRRKSSVKDTRRMVESKESEKEKEKFKMRKKEAVEGSDEKSDDD